MIWDTLRLKTPLTSQKRRELRQLCRANGAKSWADHDAKDSIAEIRTVLLEAQSERCSFCRRPLREGAADIEHFLDKARFSRWTFTLKNLSIACGDCNRLKNLRRGKGWARDPGKARWCFPRSSTLYQFVHPCFHSYSLHIVVDSAAWLYVGLTEEGAATISALRLDQLAGLEAREITARLSEEAEHVGSVMQQFRAADRRTQVEMADRLSTVIRSEAFRNAPAEVRTTLLRSATADLAARQQI
jgi:uncharacterized protein (TIGR02646 family)